MFIGPVFSSELIASARRTRYFLWRLLYAGSLLVLLVAVYLISFGLSGADTIASAANFAHYFFHSFAFAQLAAILLLGPALAAGSIARERERRTIEYLFTTHLTSGEIVLNKAAAAVVQIAGAVLVGVPVLAIAMLLGGISPDELLAVSLVTLSSITAVVALSILCSVLARRARDAIGRSYMAILALVLGPLVMRAVLRGTPAAGFVDAVSEAAGRINPLWVLSAVFDSSPVAGLDRWSMVREMVAAHLAFGLVSLALCAFMLRRMRLEAGPAAVRAGRRRSWRPKLGEYPLAWKEMFTGRRETRAARWGSTAMWLLGVLVVVGSVWQYADAVLNDRNRQFITYALWLSTLLESCALLFSAAWASNSIGAERERETWVMLISTPLTGRDIVAGKVLGSLYASRFLLVPLATLWILTAVADYRMLPAIPFTFGALVLLATSASLVGVFFSLWCQTSARALGATLGVGFVVTTFGTCCWCPFGLVSPIYLLAFPGVFNQLALSAQSFDPGVLLFGGGLYGTLWAAGIALQIGLICVLWTICTQRFDRLAGRIDLTAPPEGGRPMPVPARWIPDEAAAAMPAAKPSVPREVEPGPV